MDRDAERATRDAWAAHRAEVRRGLRPEDYQPWNETRPDGWPLQEALFAFAPDVFRSQVSLTLAEIHAFIPDAQATAILEESCWNWLRLKASQGELTATGYVNGETEEKPLRPSVFDRAELNFATKEFTSGDRTYSAVRVFRPNEALLSVATAAALPVAKGKGGRPPVYDWKAFRREVVRAAWQGEFLTRQDIRQHMTRWCAERWTDQPDERTLRTELSDLLPPEMP